MQLCQDHALNRPGIVAFGTPYPTESGDSWSGPIARLGGFLPPRQLLDMLCTVVAAELSLSMVAVMRREVNGTLTRIAGADAPAGRAQVHDHRSIDGRFVALPDEDEPSQHVVCWTFADRGKTDLLFFAGLQPLDGGRQWSDWARRVAAMVVGMPLDGIRPAAALASGDEGVPSRAAAAARRARVHLASLSPNEIDGLDDDLETEESYLRVHLEGLESLEPLGEGQWRRMLDYCWARIAAIAGEDCVATLGDGDYLLCLTGDTSTTTRVLDAIRRALLSPVPGIGSLPKLRVHFTAV